jgi:hypothetical protein
MARSNPELWRRLAEFEVSPQGAVFSFVKRLARENHWSCEFGRRVFDEYRRFLYLSVVTRQPLTPAAAVDQAWRLHITYPASYAQALCRSVLKQPLHYEPPDGNGEPAARQAAYRATLAAYQQEFGRAPPAEIWPDPDRRFAAAASAPAAPAARRPRRVGRKARKLADAPLMTAAGRA